jgi:carboxyl-terminal processing protease
MKIIKVILSVILAISSNYVIGQNSNYKINQIVSALEAIHVSPIGINDQLSQRIYSNFIEDLDMYTLIFTDSDIELFNIYKDSLDDQILNEEYPFLQLVSKIYKQRLKQADSIVNVILNNDIDFSTESSFILNSKGESTYAKNHSGLFKRWNKWIKYDILKVMYGGYPNLNFSNKDSVKYVYDYAIEKVKLENECWFNSNGLDDENYIDRLILYVFLESIALAYDPHSAYFTEEIKESFDISLSKESKSFGLSFIKKESTFRISQIDPSSSAWKSDLVHIDDIVYKITHSNGVEIDLSCMDEYDLERELFSSTFNDMVLTLIQKSGEKIEVELTKETLETVDNIMTAILLEGEKKVGFLSIPSFYTNWELSSNVGCVNDVAKELLKLQKENIEGLIIDLRFNGGGSLKEAINLTGIFVDYGSIAIMSKANIKPMLMKDFNRGRIYSGPLVVMINGASASASEVFSGALQSHNRAVIVGSQSYGKSTGQIVLPIDTSQWYYNKMEGTDFVKVTTSKLYNVNKSSHQVKGIQPDVNIPDLWEPFILKESDEKYFILNDSTTKKAYYTPYANLPITDLKNKSRSRVENDSIFNNISISNDSINYELSKEHLIPLNSKAYWAYRHISDKNYTDWKNSVTDFESKLSIRNLDYNADLEKIDGGFQKRSEAIFERRRKDIVLNEAYFILVDLINR